MIDKSQPPAEIVERHVSQVRVGSARTGFVLRVGDIATGLGRFGDRRTGPVTRIDELHTKWTGEGLAWRKAPAYFAVIEYIPASGSHGSVSECIPAGKVRKA